MKTYNYCNMTDLTLAICMYNAEKYVEETLVSVMNQTMSDFHLLIVDDCSTDGSMQRVKQFFEANNRQYELISFPENHGIAYARNFALNTAKTKYLLFIDSDDILDNRLVEMEYSLITSDSDLMGVTCWSEFINEKGQKIHGGTFLGEKNKTDFINKASRAKLIFLPIHTMFVRDLAVKAGGFVTFGFPDGRPRLQDYCEELDLWTRMSDYYSEGKAFVTVPKVLYQYRKTDSLSSNHFNMIIKMRYTKSNLLHRRTGEPEVSFMDFYKGLTSKELKGYKKEARAADALRNGVFYLKQKRIFKAFGLIFLSIVYKPSYFFEKLKYNLFS